MAAVDESQVFDLATEDDAWDFLKKMSSGSIEIEDISQLKFGNWANITVYIPGKKYNSAITPYMMQGWVELQRSIYRAYALASSGKADAKRLTDRDRELLELIVKVEEGSSDQKVDIQAVIEKVASALVNKMTGRQTAMVIVALSLVYAGGTLTKTWLNDQKEIKLAEMSQRAETSRSEERREALNAIVSLATTDRERLEVLRDVAAQVPVVEDIQQQAAEGRDELVRHVSKSDAVVNGVSIPSATGQALTSTVRMNSVESRLDGVFRILAVDTTSSTGFDVTVAGRNGQEFKASVAEVMTMLEDREVIRDAEWNKSFVHLQINGRVLRGQVVDATIIGARAYDPETDD